VGSKYSNGDECFPARVTLGDFLRIAEMPDFDPARTAFFLPTNEGPCRFGQYAHFLRKVLDDAGYRAIQILSPSDENGFEGLGDVAGPLMRSIWRSLTASDILHKVLLEIRPYELTPGAADQAYQENLDDLSQTLAASCGNAACQLRVLVAGMIRARHRFHQVPIRPNTHTPLVGVVGEVFCRMNIFSNQDLVRKLENHGAETWMSHFTEYVEYCNVLEVEQLERQKRRFSLTMLISRLRAHYQHADALALLAPFRDDFLGYEEPSAAELVRLARPYLPSHGAVGEMVLSIGKVIYLAGKGADGIVDISPFTCMNGIVSQAIYPQLSRDLGGIPIRSFFFDGTELDLDRELGIYMELVHSYSEKKRFPRRYPDRFVTPLPEHASTERWKPMDAPLGDAKPVHAE
jgi:predicted nucleotide-binding protein (sugar kinase/HSP70/actin superfamily)